MMIEFGKGDLSVSLKVITTVANGAYTGGAWFVLFGTIPTARSLKPSCCLKVTKSVMARCKPLAAMQVVTMLGGAGVYLLSRQTKTTESSWLVPASVFASMLLYKVKFLLPIRMSLLNDEVPEDEVYKTVDKFWSHKFRCALAGTGTFLFLSYLLAKK